MPINPCPLASFELGLDAFAPHSLGLMSTTRYGLRMLRGSRAGAVPGRLTLLHDESEFTIRAGGPIGLQLDGDSMGEVDSVHFRARPRALRIVG
jgi:diacylglycerol kinase family enzyme